MANFKVVPFCADMPPEIVTTHTVIVAGQDGVCFCGDMSIVRFKWEYTVHTVHVTRNMLIGVTGCW